MADTSIRNIARSVIEPIVTELGYELVDVEYKNPAGPWRIIVYIHHDNGIKFEDCELVSKTLNPILDEHEIISGRFEFLQVSSPGLDRAFGNIADYKRNINKIIDLSLYTPYEGIRKLSGKLMDVNEDSISIEVDGKTAELKINTIAKASLKIEF